MAAGSVDQCFPDWAYGHTLHSLPSAALLGLPCSPVGYRGHAKGPPTPSSGTSLMRLPGVKARPGGQCPNNTPLEVNLGAPRAGLREQGKINEGNRENRNRQLKRATESGTVGPREVGEGVVM